VVRYGTNVHLYLPLSNEIAVTNGVARGEEEPRGSETILFVEDDEDVRGVVAASLEDLGYRMLVADKGSEALELLRSAEPIDLLFSDYIMPGGISGMSLAREARSLRPDLKVLLTTGYAEHRLVDDPDANRWVIEKPYRRAALAQRIRAILEGRAFAAASDLG
jgi:CheY-like chemotaxis protein